LIIFQSFFFSHTNSLKGKNCCHWWMDYFFVTQFKPDYFNSLRAETIFQRCHQTKMIIFWLGHRKKQHKLSFKPIKWLISDQFHLYGCVFCSKIFIQLNQFRNVKEEFKIYNLIFYLKSFFGKNNFILISLVINYHVFRVTCFQKYWMHFYNFFKSSPNLYFGFGIISFRWYVMALIKKKQVKRCLNLFLGGAPY